MRIYLDEDSDEDLLLRMLTRDGHEVVSPREVGMKSAPDEAQLHFAAERGLVVITRNAVDFLRLTEHWSVPPEHPGVLIVYRDRLQTKNMSASDIVAAVNRIEHSGTEIAGACHNLNQWR